MGESLWGRGPWWSSGLHHLISPALTRNPAVNLLFLALRKRLGQAFAMGPVGLPRTLPSKNHLNQMTWALRSPPGGGQDVKP